MIDSWHLIGSAIRDEIINAGAWQNSVFLGRSSAIDGDEYFPNICIYVNNQSSVKKVGAASFAYSSTVEIEIRERRKDADSEDCHTGQFNAENRLALVSAEIKSLVFNLLDSGRINSAHGVLSFEPIDEISTEIVRNSTGEVPHILAMIKFNLQYNGCFEKELQILHLPNIFTQINMQTCSENVSIINSVITRNMEICDGM